MITSKDFYNVLAKMVPLYVTMIIAYGSVKWWKIITAEQCSGINKYVSFFAVPFFSFKFISNNNPYDMNWPFILADTLQKLIVLVLLFLWCKFSSRSSLEWSITLFSLSTLPNTLAMGIPLLTGMYGEMSAPLMVQIVVMQCIVWYTLLLFLFEYRAGSLLIAERFPENGNEIRSISVDCEVISLNESKESLETEAEIREDGKLHVSLRKSTSVGSGTNSLNIIERGLSNLSNVEIYSLPSSRGGSMFVEVDNLATTNIVNERSNLRSSSVGNSRFDERKGRDRGISSVYLKSSFGSKSLNQVQGGGGGGRGDGRFGNPTMSIGGSFLPTVRSPPAMVNNGEKDHVTVKSSSVSKGLHVLKECDYYEKKDPSENRPEIEGGMLSTLFSSRSSRKVQPEPENVEECEAKPNVMPPATVMTKLILVMVWRKLIRNPNTYASVIGLVWSLIACRFHIKFPAIIDNSIKIISDTGLGMVMFSLGLFMALQPQIIAGGHKMAMYAAIIRFIAGPAVAAASSAIVGLRGTILRISIVQASLPEGIVPFVFAKQFDVHPEILSTAAIFGLVIALPISLVYYIVLGLFK